MPFLAFIHFKITSNSFIYSLVDQFFETIFTKIITGVRGILLEKKNLPKFSGLYTPLIGVWGILYEQHTNIIIVSTLKILNENYFLKKYQLETLQLIEDKLNKLILISDSNLTKS